MKRLIVSLILVSTGCAYMGFHGKSVKRFPDIHESFVEDSECLECHHPETRDENAPVSPHPTFTGCLKCHNDVPK